MPTTTNLALPYPALSSAPNVPQDLQSLAAAVDTSLAGVYVDYSASVVFYSNATAGTTISGASVVVTHAVYQVVGKRCHYEGHATINTTTASGFAIGLPFAAPIRSLAMPSVYLHGASGYTTSFGAGHVPSISAPFNRVCPVSATNANLNIVASGDTVRWNITYRTV